MTGAVTAVPGSAAAIPDADAFHTDGEFACLVPMHSAEERGALEASLLAHGCREPLVLWKEEKVLLDGHTRFQICTSHGIAFEVTEYSFATRDDARNWIIDNALARRNLTKEQISYLRGKRLLVEKKERGRPSEERRQGDAISEGRTRDKIAAKAGVSARTVERDAEFAEAVDKIAKTAGTKAKSALLSGKVKLTREQVKAAADQGVRNLAQLRRVGKSAPKSAPARPAEKDHVGEIANVALRLSAAIDAYTKSGLRSSDRPRLASLWELRAEIEGLNAALKGQE